MEHTALAKGIFWIVDRNNTASSTPYCVRIPCTPNGQSIVIDMAHLAKSGDTYNHERYWKSVPKALTLGKTFDYYPRGRVEIAHGKATIYLNPNIATDEVVDYIKASFGLTAQNGVTKVLVKVDGSNHYRCHLD